MPEQLDPDAVNLSKAIRQTESGGNFKAKGKSGEYGAYQFTAPTWNTYAKKYGVSVPLEQATPEQQNEVAYKQIKAWKDSGYNVGQIASLWNSGKPDAYQDTGYKGVNKFGVTYDVPAYAKSVATAYHTIKGGGTAGIDPANPSSTASTQNAQPKEQGLGGKLLGRLNDASTAISEGTQGKINPLSSSIQTLGAGAGAVGDVVGSALELIPGVKQVEGLIGKGAGALAQTGLGQKVVGGAEQFAQQHPELSKDIGAVGNIASLLPIGKGLGIAKDAAGAGINKAIGKTVLSNAMHDLSPELSIKTGAKTAAKGGLVTSGLLGETKLATNKSIQDIANTVTQNVPDYPKLNNFADKLNATRDTVYRLADDLKKQVIQSGEDRIYPFKELSSAMRAIEKPIALKADPVLYRQFELARNAALKIAQQEGGTISSLFDARKAFDALVEKQFPNLYERANAPMRDAITGIRNTMNDFIEKNLPKEVAFKQSLKTQSHLFKAIEMLSKQAYKEVGSNKFTRFGSKHPIVKGLLKKAAETAAIGLTGGAGYGLYKGLTE